jgi:alcohol dehydrogenase
MTAGPMTAGPMTAGPDGPAAWTFTSPVRIVFGAGVVEPLRRHVRPGQRVLLVTTAGALRRDTGQDVLDALRDTALTVVDDVPSNPPLDWLVATIDRVQGHHDLLVALGGGSAIDVGKVLSVTVAGGPPLRALLDGGTAPAAAVPLVAVPTTAGTGSEVTPFATVWDHQAKRKLSLASDLLLPVAAVLDPTTTLTLPADTTASTGLDALTQAFDSLCGRTSSPVTEPLAATAVRLVLPALPTAVADGSDLTARTRMLEASLLAGLAISSTRTGMTHAVSYPLTAHHGVPHGLACALPLPGLFRYYAQHDDGRLHRLAQTCGLPDTAALGAALHTLLTDVDLGTRLRTHLTDTAQVHRLIPEMFTPGRADNSFVTLDQTALTDVLTTSLADLQVPTAS